MLVRVASRLGVLLGLRSLAVLRSRLQNSQDPSKRRRIFALVQAIWKDIESSTERRFQNA